jgi:PDZ domain-containing secreted protein
MLVVLSGINYSLVRPGHREDISELVKVTRDIVKERVKGDAWMLWAIAQRASLPLKIEACVT